MQSLLKKGLRFSETRGFRVQRERERDQQREKRERAAAHVRLLTLSILVGFFGGLIAFGVYASRV